MAPGGELPLRAGAGRGGGGAQRAVRVPLPAGVRQAVLREERGVPRPVRQVRGGLFRPLPGAAGKAPGLSGAPEPGAGGFGEPTGGAGRPAPGPRRAGGAGEPPQRRGLHQRGERGLGGVPQRAQRRPQRAGHPHDWRRHPGDTGGNHGPAPRWVLYSKGAPPRHGQRLQQPVLGHERRPHPHQQRGVPRRGRHRPGVHRPGGLGAPLHQHRRLQVVPGLPGVLQPPGVLLRPAGRAGACHQVPGGGQCQKRGLRHPGGGAHRPAGLSV